MSGAGAKIVNKTAPSNAFDWEGRLPSRPFTQERTVSRLPILLERAILNRSIEIIERLVSRFCKAGGLRATASSQIKQRAGAAVSVAAVYDRRWACRRPHRAPLELIQPIHRLQDLAELGIIH